MIFTFYIDQFILSLQHSQYVYPNPFLQIHFNPTTILFLLILVLTLYSTLLGKLCAHTGRRGLRSVLGNKAELESNTLFWIKHLPFHPHAYFWCMLLSAAWLSSKILSPLCGQTLWLDFNLDLRVSHLSMLTNNYVEFFAPFLISYALQFDLLLQVFLLHLKGYYSNKLDRPTPCMLSFCEKF